MSKHPPAAQPETALSVAVSDFLHRSSPPVLANHCRRTFVFGAALLREAGRAYDPESLFVGSCLHDLGLLSQNEDGRTAFEVRGADLARAQVLALGGSAALADLIHEAVALHLDLSTADHPVPEIAGVSLGAAVDVLGLRLDQVPQGVVDAALSAYERGGIKEWLIGAMQAEASAKPDSVVASYIRQVDFLELIRAAPFDS